MTIAYRTPTMADVDALCELGRDTFVDTFGHLYTAKDLAAFLEQVFGPTGLPVELASPDYHYRVAEADGRLIAYCKIGKPYLPIERGDRRTLELCQLYVRRAWQGAGVAAALMDWALGLARDLGIEDLYLSVWSENARAQRFYARYGFVEVGRYAFMVGEQADDDRIWKLTLTPEPVA